MVAATLLGVEMDPAVRKQNCLWTSYLPMDCYVVGLLLSLLQSHSTDRTVLLNVEKGVHADMWVEDMKHSKAGSQLYYG